MYKIRKTEQILTRDQIKKHEVVIFQYIQIFFNTSKFYKLQHQVLIMRAHKYS